MLSRANFDGPSNSPITTVVKIPTETPDITKGKEEDKNAGVKTRGMPADRN
jgi:hypothetical protein